MTKRLKASTEQRRRDLVGKWKESGLSQAEFCRQEGIPEWRLSEWKRRVVRAAGILSQMKKGKRKPRATSGKSAAVEDSATAKITEAPNPKIGPFMPLVPVPANGARKLRGMNYISPVAEIQLDGMVVRIFPGADHETLRALLHVLQEVSLC